MKFSLAAIIPLAAVVLAAPTPDTTPAHEEGSLIARATNGEFTWYEPGLGACGKWNSRTDLVVALGKGLFDPQTPGGNPNNNKLCGRRIRARYNGKSVDVTVADRCEGCKPGDLDLSPAAFERLAALGVGRMKGNWDWI